MIPKIIHYTWFSGEEMPPIVKDCIASWKRVMPDYEYRLWDMEAIMDLDSEFLKEALAVKKWAYAADYVRLYALYQEGGIYLDTDVELLKPLDDFLYDDHVISDIVREFERTETDFIYGNGIFVDAQKTNKIVRRWRGGSYRRWKVRYGWLPLHPTCYISYLYILQRILQRQLQQNMPTIERDAVLIDRSLQRN